MSAFKVGDIVRPVYIEPGVRMDLARIGFAVKDGRLSEEEAEREIWQALHVYGRWVPQEWGTVVEAGVDWGGYDVCVDFGPLNVWSNHRHEYADRRYFFKNDELEGAAS